MAMADVTSNAALTGVSLDDKYELGSGRVFVTGIQALVRLLLLQRQPEGDKAKNIPERRWTKLIS
jgi:hypothetical protein